MSTVFLSLQKELSAAERVSNLLRAHPVLAQTAGNVNVILGNPYVVFTDLGYEAATLLFGADGWTQSVSNGKTYIDKHDIAFGVSLSVLVCEGKGTTGGGATAPGASSPAFPQNETNNNPATA